MRNVHRSEKGDLVIKNLTETHNLKLCRPTALWKQEHFLFFFFERAIPFLCIILQNVL